MLRMLVDGGVPVMVFSAMLVIGAALTANIFLLVTCQPDIVFATTVGQFAMLPIIAWLLRKFEEYGSCGRQFGKRLSSGK